ncbi:TOPLESS-related 2 isoform 1 [Hibiscus syriacus]|uniref:TOPLESS-related 2 isoform 1 n=1 Tax=Hibiscus syriacus TaxID=106335 RepID=A0A6A3D353_HIBSY|nr:TOPLESS-related 2 isoform 1 [Hibiscus syriacus]
MELYSTELHLFKDLASIKESRNLLFCDTSSVIQPILEKGIVDHLMIHRVLGEYLSIVDQSSAADIIQQLSGHLLVRMIHTRDGSKIGMLCVKHGIAKVLVGIVSMVDDTKLITKFVIRELQATLKELALDKSGRRLLLQLLHPDCSLYLNSDGLAFLNLSVMSLSAKNDSEVGSEKISRDESGKVAAKSDIPEENLDEEHTKEAATTNSDMTETRSGKSDIPEENLYSAEGGKKDPLLRRRELLVKSGWSLPIRGDMPLFNLVDVCIENVGELLTSNFGKEVAMGGSDGILHPTLDEKLSNLRDAISALAAKPISEEPEELEEEHVLENFHSSRTIRKLVLDCPAFASTLWKKSLERKCQLWAQGHSSKVVSAFWESSDSEVRKMAKEELKPLIDGGILKILENKQFADED